MSDVIISRRGSGKSKSGNGNTLITEYITFNQNWVVPYGVKNNEFSVRIFGAGATVNAYTINNNSGGSGWMNNDIFTLTPGEIIPITIGQSIDYENSYNNRIHNIYNSAMYQIDLINYLHNTGPSSSFGTLLSANGGKDKNGGSGGSGGNSSDAHGGRGYQFGGGGTFNGNGGNGGVWGGGGGGGNNYKGYGNGGYGGLYGGGGGCSLVTSNLGHGGNGGKYGGGGGGAIIKYSGGGYKTYPGIGGEFGGNGGNRFTNIVGNDSFITNLNSVSPENGTNTIGDSNVPSLLQGNGCYGGFGVNDTKNNNAYYNGTGGGGGYGGNGGCGFGNIINLAYVQCVGGGGGGYGSNGGNAGFITPGGGGGYGGDGGSGSNRTSPYGGFQVGFPAGGGGYGKGATGGGGGGGYYCPGGGINLTGGGGGYGIWQDNKFIKSYASGGFWNKNTSAYIAEPGICIIQYYV